MTERNMPQPMPGDSQFGRAPQIRNVLLVDDDVFQRKVISRVLETQFAAKVTEASDGQRALTLLQSQPDTFDLILCDLDMPVMDGMAFVRHLGALAGGVRLAIISGGEPALISSVISMCHAYGIKPLGGLKKPLQPEDLKALLDHQQGAEQNTPAAQPSTGPQFNLDEISAASERHEFEAFFQPKACVSSGRIVAAEALARWRHPRFGVLPPHPYFITQLENSGNIAGITEVILSQAVAACRQWHDQGHELGVSVNLSQQQLQDDVELAERISTIVRDAGLKPAHLTLEITETVAATDIGPVLENLARLKLRGFGLSIDDFGTGYSSLEQLSRVAFNELKIDRGFVADMVKRAESRTIVASCIAMAGNMGMRSVAEGVENAEEWNMLRAMGCDQIQGFYLGRPMDVTAFSSMLAERAA